MQRSIYHRLEANAPEAMQAMRLVHLPPLAFVLTLTIQHLEKIFLRGIRTPCHKSWLNLLIER